MWVLMDAEGEDVLRFKNHIKGDLQTSVWPGYVPPGSDPISLCPQVVVFGLTPIANGWSRYIWNDNDVNPGLNPDRHNMNSAGFNAHGVLVNYETGEPMRFKMRFHGIWDGLDPESIRTILELKLQ